MKRNSDAKIAAIRRYEEKTYDRFTVRLPKGTKEQIQATGKSLNSFILDAINEKLK